MALQMVCLLSFCMFPFEKPANCDMGLYLFVTNVTFFVTFFFHKLILPVFTVKTFKFFKPKT